MTNLFITHHTNRNTTSRRYRVGTGKRIASKIFGSPSIRIAYGGVKSNLLFPYINTVKKSREFEFVPIFSCDRKGTKQNEQLPRIWLSEPNYNTESNKIAGRTLITVYPNGKDKGGIRALELAEHYLGEAHTYESENLFDNTKLSADCNIYTSDETIRLMRIACYQAAEILCLHAAHRGNIKACVYLAKIYKQDLCEGRYWKDAIEEKAKHVKKVNIGYRSILWLLRAARHQDPEACLKLGDIFSQYKNNSKRIHKSIILYRSVFYKAQQGIEEKFNDTDILYSNQRNINESKVYKMASDTIFAGEAALRIGRYYEEGIEHVQSFKKAYSWYYCAFKYLNQAINKGYWHCKRSYNDAKNSVARMAQEINGKY